MSKIVLNAACGCKLHHTVKAVLKELAWFADDAGRNTFPSVKTLAERTGLSRRSVQKLLRRLEEMGAIRALGSRLGGRHRTTRYSIDLGWLERNGQTANELRPFSQDASIGEIEKGELDSGETANSASQKSARHSPDQEEQKYENRLRRDRTAPEEPRQGTPYEHQRLQQRIRKGLPQTCMPSPMTADDVRVRKALLKRQVELWAKAQLGTP